MHYYLMRQLTLKGDINLKIETDTSLADLGGVPGTRSPPQGPRFFRFDTQNFRNVTASGVGIPSYEVDAPLMEILDAPLHII